MPRLSKIGAACLSAFGFGTGGAAAVTASYLVVAGGGGGGRYYSGGGGAGGLLTGSSLSLNTTLTYTVVVGAGGAALTGSSSGVGTAGSNSSAFSLSAIGGGYGSGNQSGGTAGGNGGSGGGGGGTASASGGTATSGQGNAGGSTSGNYGAGGGGAGAVGGGGSSGVGGAGGIGVSSSITGTATYYAAGGGGSANTVGAGGSSIGGNGANDSTAGTSGVSNTGSGGGGGSSPQVGGNGGSGVVIVAYAGAQKFGGGIVSSDGTNTIHTFKTSGQLVPMTPITASYLIVAGGASGGGLNSGGGGGAGGLLTGSTLSIDTSSTYLVTVGAGGTGTSSGAQGNNGTSSSFSLIGTTAVGGGGGGTNSITGSPSTGATGGSGGGGAYNGGAGGSATTSQGYAGGTGSTSAGVGAGGGGAGAAGASPTSHTSSRAGGVGISSSITGTATYYAGGGGGGSNGGASARGYGDGGLGGGGAGGIGYDGPTASSGTANTGGGGGGAGGPSYTLSGNGGSGVVVISYAGTTQLMAGGTVTIVGGNVIHTFTSSGYLTPLTFIGRSLRFRSSASAYLNRTHSVASNRKTWTWSGWVKRGAFGTTRQCLFGGWSSDSDSNWIEFGFGGSTDSDTNDSFYVTTAGAGINSTAVFRDPAAWYHIVVALDTTQSTNTDRLKLWVNGKNQNIAAVSTLSLNLDAGVNQSANHSVSKSPRTGTNRHFDGYQANVQFIDGQALTPNSFGTYNSYGVWQPINYGGSYGTNGFYLPFSDTTSTTTLVADKSPQGNHWTPNNISLTAGTTYDSMTDVPTLTSATAANYAVLNPILGNGNPPSFSNGNLTISPSGSGYNNAIDTISMSSTGYWYAEFTATANVPYGGGNNNGIGIISVDSPPLSGSTYIGKSSITYGYFDGGGLYNNDVASQTVASFATNDVIMIALGNGKLWWGKNGTWLGTGSPNPATATSPAYSGLSGDYFFGLTTYSSPYGGTFAANFGQQGFKYTPPTGFVALNTYNL